MSRAARARSMEKKIRQQRHAWHETDETVPSEDEGVYTPMNVWRCYGCDESFPRFPWEGPPSKHQEKERGLDPNCELHVVRQVMES